MSVDVYSEDINLNNKWIDKSVLPKKQNQIDWKKSVGIKVPFIYHEYSGEITICAWRPGELDIQYNGDIVPIKIRSFDQAKLGRALGFRNYSWIYEIGDECINDEGNRFKVVDREIRSTSMSMSSRFYKLECNVCGESNWYFENDIGRECPVCNNYKIVQGKNDLWTTDRRIAMQLLHPEDGKQCSIGKRVYLDWKCPTCGEIRKGLTPMQVKKTLDGMVPCPSCSDGYSYPNKFMFNILTEINQDFENEKTFDWNGLGGRKYDFYIEEHSMIIEMHGEQHYQETNFTDLESVQRNDAEKRKIAIDNGIRVYIVINASKSNAEFIFNNILNSSLPEYFNFDSIDIREIDTKASKRIRQRVFEILESVNYDFTMTARLLKIDRVTVSKYVNDAIKKGLIEEQPIRDAQNANKIKMHYQIDGQPLHCIELDLYFGSGRELKDFFATRFNNKKFH